MPSAMDLPGLYFKISRGHKQRQCNGNGIPLKNNVSKYSIYGKMPKDTTTAVHWVLFRI